MQNYFALAAPQFANSQLDFSPISNALERQRIEDNDAYNRQRQAQQDKIAAEERQFNRNRLVKADELAVKERLANQALAYDQLTDPIQRQAGLQRILGEHPNANNLPEAYKNPSTAFKLIAADYGKFRDDLDREYKQSQIASNLAQAEKYKAAAANGGSDFGKTVLNGYDEKGNPIPMVVKGDKLIRVQSPDGVAFDPTKAAADKKRAEAKGEAQAALPDILEQAGFMRNQVDAIRNDPNLANVTGGWDGLIPNIRPSSKNVQSKIDNIDAQQYMLAFQKMRGAGAISNQEGLAASKAISRIKDQTLSDEDYLKALDELKMVIHNGVIKAKIKAGELPETALSQLYPFDDAGNPSAYAGSEKQIGSLNSDTSGITIRQVK